jgi:outer membrane receptor protein involved in Fe transport
MQNKLLTIIALTSASTALAQERAIEEILVFGEVRETELNELPASVSVISADQLTRRSARHIEDALSLTANVNVASGSSRSRFFQIRGIGERGQFIEPLNPSVGVLIDGVDISNAATAATLFDIDQIEVFRGPQGTRYGANALAGLINIRTRGPGTEPDAELGIDLGNYDSATLFGALSGPLSEAVSGRIAWQHHADDGFIANEYLGRDDTNKRDESSFRGKLRWQPAPEATIDVMIGRIDIDNGYDAFSLDNDRTTLSDEPGRDEQLTNLASVRGAWGGTDSVRVEATVGFADSDSIYGYDEDWTYAGFHPFGYSSTDYYFRNRSTVTTEIRVLSRDAAALLGGRGHWAVGIYSLDASEDLDRDYTFAASRFSSNFAVDRRAAFGQLDFDVTATTRLSAGIRIEQHDSRYSDTDGGRFSPGDSLDGWRLSLDHHFGDALMGYVLLAGGYKAGGFNTNGTLSPELRNFGPEESTNLELGVKGDLLGGRLQMQLAWFDMDRDEIQIEQSIVIERDDGSSEFVEYIDNGVSGRNSGIEAEISYAPRDAWMLHASVGFLDTEYDAYVNPGGDDLSGRAQAHAPKYQFSVSSMWQFGSDSWFELAVDGRDAFYFSSSHNARSKAWSSVNAAAGFGLGRWDVSLWGRNLTDEDIYTRGYFFGNDPRIGYEARSYTQLAEPRRVGVGVSRTFR